MDDLESAPRKFTLWILSQWTFRVRFLPPVKRKQLVSPFLDSIRHHESSDERSQVENDVVKFLRYSKSIPFFIGSMFWRLMYENTCRWPLLFLTKNFITSNIKMVFVSMCTLEFPNKNMFIEHFHPWLNFYRLRDFCTMQNQTFQICHLTCFICQRGTLSVWRTSFVTI